MALDKCCGCVDLRTGAIVIAILQILGAFGQIGESRDWNNIIGMLLGIGAGACLLFGAIQYNPTATLINLIFTIIGIVILIIGGILVLTVASVAVSTATESREEVDGAIAGAVVVVAVLFIGFAALEIYFCVCVYSFYIGLKNGSIHYRDGAPLPTQFQPGQILDM